jgi:hypothetical protein
MVTMPLPWVRTNHLERTEKVLVSIEDNKVIIEIIQ